jgi:hypothetical protein
MRTFDFMKQFSIFVVFAPASGGSAPSRSAHAESYQFTEQPMKAGDIHYDY